MPGKVKTLRSQGGEEERHQNKHQGSHSPVWGGLQHHWHWFSAGHSWTQPVSYSRAGVSSTPHPSTQVSVSASAGSSQEHSGTASPALCSRQAPQQIIWGFLFVCLFYISCWEKKKSPPLIPSKALSSLPHDVSWLLSAPPKFPKTQLHPSGAVWPWVLEKFKRCRSSNHWFPKSQYRVWIW